MANYTADVLHRWFEFLGVLNVTKEICSSIWISCHWLIDYGCRLAHYSLAIFDDQRCCRTTSLPKYVLPVELANPWPVGAQLQRLWWFAAETSPIPPRAVLLAGKKNNYLLPAVLMDFSIGKCDLHAPCQTTQLSYNLMLNFMTAREGICTGENHPRLLLPVRPAWHLI